ncbi:MAG: hypothetical protein GC157_15575 [Frankiales bacterium]|nr:hypothetical protein [Frankiales bacterium]
MRLRRYARAMGWDLTTSGVLVGDVEGVAVRAYEERGRSTVIELVAPGVLPRMEMVVADRHVAQVGDGMRDVHLGDPTFEARYVVRAAEPWFARAVVDATVRRALLAAPAQTWVTRDDRLVGRSSSKLEPLDLFARATALRTLIAAVPWEAYEDRTTPPALEAVQGIVTERRSRPIERLPSMPRHA